MDQAVLSFIPAGDFEMGGEISWSNVEPAHIVYLDDFWIYQTEITNKMYSLCVEAGTCEKPNSSYYGIEEFADYPVENVDWYDAQTYCEWGGGRLPTEAEWEKAARGGLEGMLYPWGDEKPVCDLGANNGAQFIECNGETVPVGSFAPNGYGLYDMVGNVKEWVADWYNAYYYRISTVKNPQGPEDGEQRVLRGGSWQSVNEIYTYTDLYNRNHTIFNFFLNVAFRLNNFPEYSEDDYGFRCAFSASP